MISEAILIHKIYARLQQIASNFSKFSGGGPPQTQRRRSRLRRSVRPLPAPLSKIPGSAPDTDCMNTALANLLSEIIVVGAVLYHCLRGFRVILSMTLSIQCLCLGLVTDRQPELNCR